MKFLHPLEKMGNVESSSYKNYRSRFLPEEQTEIDGMFDAISGLDGSSGIKDGKTPQKSISLEMLEAYVGEALPKLMIARLYNGMRNVDLMGKSSGPSEHIIKEQSVVFMSDLLKGNAEEKSVMIMKMLSAVEGPVKGKHVQEFTEDLITSVVHVLNYRNELKGWSLETMRDSASGVKTLAAQLFSELKFQDGEKPEGPAMLDASCDRKVLEDWVFRVPQIGLFLSVVIRHGFHILHPHPEVVNLIPKCKGGQGKGFVSVLDLPSITYVNSHLPTEVQHKWKLLFSSQVHGESFSQLCGHITHRGPCVMVLKDSGGYIFGGFASVSWEVKPQFQGDSKCFLFSIYPRIEVYPCTGYNEHFMYLNHGQQTMPNGLGMGGQHDYFGLWIDSDFGKGHSRAKPRCTTYNSPQLSANENFKIDALEVWAVGDLPESEVNKGKKSILDADPEAQALLEMTGKSRQSEGLREVAEDDDEK
uniref:MTOR-associated protein MEAK7 n=1 Tax=Ornithorhynchus anatinus TaxID=9258 RepID=A0A6I8P0R2_ORNAN